MLCLNELVRFDHIVQLYVFVNVRGRWGKNSMTPQGHKQRTKHAKGNSLANCHDEIIEISTKFTYDTVFRLCTSPDTRLNCPVLELPTFDK
jgi:hypothetical protein